MKIIKLFTVLCVLSGIVLGFSGCGLIPSNSNSNSSTVTQSQGTQATGKSEVSDTIRWMNGTYAILTKLNNADYNLVGGYKPTEQIKKAQIEALEEWWGVTDKATADETLEWVLEEGHRIDFAETMNLLDIDGAADMTHDELVAFIDKTFENEEMSIALANSYATYTEFGENAINAWDYGRAMSLVGWYYIAGYYTLEESLDKSLEIAKKIQSEFTSWDEFNESYFRGYEYWAEESSEERRKVYEGIKKQADSPYNLDWNLTLEKTW